MIGNMCEIKKNKWIKIPPHKKKKKERKEKKKRGKPGVRSYAISSFLFARYTLSPVGHGGALFRCEEKPFNISFLILCDITWPNVNKSFRFTVKIRWFLAHSFHFELIIHKDYVANTSCQHYSCFNGNVKYNWLISQRFTVILKRNVLCVLILLFYAL